jgi:hypothetical protein
LLRVSTIVEIYGASDDHVSSFRNNSALRYPLPDPVRALQKQRKISHPTSATHKVVTSIFETGLSILKVQFTENLLMRNILILLRLYPGV